MADELRDQALLRSDRTRCPPAFFVLHLEGQDVVHIK